MGGDCGSRAADSARCAVPLGTSAAYPGETGRGERSTPHSGQTVVRTISRHGSDQPSTLDARRTVRRSKR
jgi:hypothetical protein